MEYLGERGWSTWELVWNSWMSGLEYLGDGCRITWGRGVGWSKGTVIASHPIIQTMQPCKGEHGVPKMVSTEYQEVCARSTDNGEHGVPDG